MRSHPHSALLLVGHGSTQNPDSSAPTLAHADAIRARGVFAEVECCFWKEEPSMREAQHLFAAPEVFVVPNFISEGYFTQTVIPRELGLAGRETHGANGRVWKYCEPAGSHPAMTELLLRRAREVAPGVDPREAALLIVGHGTGLNDNSAVAAKRQAERIRARGEYAEVLNAYMEEPPLIAEWDRLTTAPHVIVVPFFIADGLHSFQDIPVLLGLETDLPAAASQGEIFRQNPRALRGRQLYYAAAIGTDPGFADVLLDLVETFGAPDGHDR